MITKTTTTKTTPTATATPPFITDVISALMSSANAASVHTVNNSALLTIDKVLQQHYAHRNSAMLTMDSEGQYAALQPSHRGLLNSTILIDRVPTQYYVHYKLCLSIMSSPSEAALHRVQCTLLTIDRVPDSYIRTIGRGFAQHHTHHRQGLCIALYSP